MTNLTIAILAGGKSIRMGQDKADLAAPGQPPLLLRTVHLARATGAPVLVVGRERPDHWPEAGASFVPDAAPEQGPMGGLVTALRHVGGSVCLLGCDMPHLSMDALRWLLADNAAAVAAVAGEHLQPLFAVYPTTTLPELEARLAQGDRSLTRFLREQASAGHFLLREMPEWVVQAICDVDTPEDWQRAIGAA